MLHRAFGLIGDWRVHVDSSFGLSELRARVWAFASHRMSTILGSLSIRVPYAECTSCLSSGNCGLCSPRPVAGTIRSFDYVTLELCFYCLLF